MITLHHFSHPIWFEELGAFEKEENINLVNNPNYNKVIDSLKIILDNRITAVRKKPKGLGRQLKNAKPNFEPKRIYSSEKFKF